MSRKIYMKFRVLSMQGVVIESYDTFTEAFQRVLELGTSNISAKIVRK